jgi:dUTP pyrophosphatase
MSNLIDLKIINKAIENNLPEYSTLGSAGLDLRACIEENIKLHANDSVLIPSGIAIHIKNKNLCGIILPRSGLGHKHGIVLGNLVGLIDSDYQGEILISLWNRTNKEYEIKPLDRIAQLVFMPVELVKFNLVESFVESSRGGAGFGSTGTN